MMVTKREVTTARNKQAILWALLKRMGDEPFEEIKISDLCKDASVSEASFYNYFPQKTDILVYFIQLWSVEIEWKIRYEYNTRGLKAVERFFKETAQSTIEHPSLLAEIVGFLARWDTLNGQQKLKDADKLVAYPEYEGVECCTAEGLDSLLLPNLHDAVVCGELPQQTPAETVALAVTSLFFGIPMLIRQVPVRELEYIFIEQLQLIWDGARKRYYSAA